MGRAQSFSGALNLQHQLLTHTRQTMQRLCTSYDVSCLYAAAVQHMTYINNTHPGDIHSQGYRKMHAKHF